MANENKTNDELLHEIALLKTQLIEQKLINDKLSEVKKLAMIGHWDWDYEKNLLTWSDEIFEIFGVTRENFEVSTENFEKAIHPDDLCFFLTERENALKANVNINIVHRIVCPNGEIRIVQEQATILRKNNQPTKLLGTVQDITERYHREHLFAEHRERFETIFNMLPSLLGIANLQTATFTLINPAFTKTLGYSIEELTEKPFFEFIHPDDVEKTKQVIETKLNSGQSIVHFVNRYRCKNGKYRWFDWNSHPIPEKNIIYTIGHDITSLVEAEQLIIANEQKMNAILLAIPDMLFILNDKNIFVEFYTSKVEDLYAQPKHFIGKHITEVFNSEIANNILKTNALALETNQLQTYEYTLPIADEIRYYEAKIIAFENNKLLSLVRDISTLKNNEVKLKELNTEKDRFIQILAHDLRSPFNTLLGFSDILLRNIRKFDIEKTEAKIKIINEMAYRTFNLLEDLLLWTRTKSQQMPFKPTNISVSALINEVITLSQLQANAKNIAIKHIEKESLTVFADNFMLKTVIRNLVSNAIKFTQRNGEITLETTLLDSEIIFTVSDNGVGIAPDDLKRIWSLTEKIQYKGTEGEVGTGFGLLICKEFITKHNGKIWVESEEHKGSRFMFSIPNE